MPRTRKQSPDGAITNLAQGVYQDIEKLIGQHIQLLGRELKDELAKAAKAGASFGGGATFMALGTMLGGLATIHLIHKATGWPLWLCYAGCSATACAVGAGLVAAGAAQAADVRLIPEQTVREIKHEVAGALS